MTRTFKKVQNSAYRFTEKRVLPAFLFKKCKRAVTIAAHFKKIIMLTKIVFLVML